jgi:hypothetical protein
MDSLANYSLTIENGVNGSNLNTVKVFREDRLALQGAEITYQSLAKVFEINNGMG